MEKFHHLSKLQVEYVWCFYIYISATDTKCVAQVCGFAVSQIIFANILSLPTVVRFLSHAHASAHFIEIAIHIFHCLLHTFGASFCYFTYVHCCCCCDSHLCFAGKNNANRIEKTSPFKCLCAHWKVYFLSL